MNILLIAPTHMDIYKDVINELERMGHIVDFAKTPILNSDPRSFVGYRRLSKYLVSENYFLKKITKYWTGLLNSKEYDKKYDFLFVIDGHGVRKVVFDILRNRNSDIKAVNYLFDTTSGVYQFEKNFGYFDRVYSFDTTEVKKYNLCFLPIFWTTIAESLKEYDFFGMGYYNKQRYDLFRILEEISDKNGLKSYLKLYYPYLKRFGLYKLKYSLKKMLGMKLNIPPVLYYSRWITHESLSPSDFKSYIAKSMITIDTCAPHQVGMTARYMWALGNGKKIITTNLNAAKEGLYEEGQVFVIKDLENLADNNDFLDFINAPYHQSNEHQSLMIPYRIDNWLSTILGA